MRIAKINVADFVGKKINHLTILSNLGSQNIKGKYRRRVLAQCDCSTKTIREFDFDKIWNNHTKSCGCVQKESASYVGKENKTHGQTKTVEYKTWRSMLDRCYLPKNIKYPLYGGKGIQVCDRWRESFENFYADMGDRPSDVFSIDRINSNGHYEPSNCRWADILTQNNNKKNNLYLTYQGKTLTISQWARELNISNSTLYNRKNKGWTDLDILSTPIINYSL